MARPQGAPALAIALAAASVIVCRPDAAAAQTPSAAAPDYDRAVQERLAGRLDQAIEAFRTLSQRQPRDADVWLNLGLAYTAKGRFAEAEAALSRGLAVAPDYPDLQIAYARIAYFRGDIAEARRRLAPSLAHSPVEPDARDLARQLDAAQRAGRAFPWRLDAATSYSRLSNGLAPWREWDVAASRRLGRGTTLGVGFEETSRFHLSDSYVHGLFDQAIGGRGAGVSLDIGGAPGGRYRAQAIVQAGARAPALRLGGEVRLQGELNGSYAHYATGDVSSIQPQATLTIGDRASLEARYIHTMAPQGATLDGYSLRGEAAVTRALRLNLGWADAPDSEAGVTVQVQAVSGGASVDLGRATTLRFTVTHEDRRAFARDEYAFALTQRF